MNEWLNKMLFGDESFPEKFFHLAIVIFAFLFVFFWAWLILNFILTSILDGIKWLHEKRNGYDADFDFKMYLAEEKLERIFKFPSQIVPRIFRGLNSNTRINLNLIKSIVFGLAIPIIAVWIWNVSSNKPFNEYLLITESKTAKGQITKAKEYDDIVEINDGRNSRQIFYYLYEYNFRLPNNSTINGLGREDGTLPEYLYELNENPYDVQVQYLPKNPTINRVKNMPGGHYTIYEWLRYSVLLGIVVLFISSYFGFLIIKTGIKDYRNSKKELVGK